MPCAGGDQTTHFNFIQFHFRKLFIKKKNTVGINTEVFIDLLTTNVNSYFRCCSLLMMTFSASTVDSSEFIFFRGKQIILHSAIDSTLDARVQNKRILQDNLYTFFLLTKRIKVGKK